MIDAFNLRIVSVAAGDLTRAVLSISDIIQIRALFISRVM